MAIPLGCKQFLCLSSDLESFPLAPLVSLETKWFGSEPLGTQSEELPTRLSVEFQEIGPIPMVSCFQDSASFLGCALFRNWFPLFCFIIFTSSWSWAQLQTFNICAWFHSHISGPWQAYVQTPKLYLFAFEQRVCVCFWGPMYAIKLFPPIRIMIAEKCFLLVVLKEKEKEERTRKERKKEKSERTSKRRKFGFLEDNFNIFKHVMKGWLVQSPMICSRIFELRTASLFAIWNIDTSIV